MVGEEIRLQELGSEKMITPRNNHWRGNPELLLRDPMLSESFNLLRDYLLVFCVLVF